MSGGFSAGGLITGIDSNSLIRQLLQLERQPITRFQARIDALERQQTGLRDLRTVLQTLRTRIQNFRTGTGFDQFAAEVSTPAVLRAQISGSNPPAGSFSVDVTQLATATVATSSSRIGSPINTAAALNSSGLSTQITAGTFTINGVQFGLDPNAQNLDTMLLAISTSAAGVTATYDNVTDTVTIANTTPGDTSVISFGGPGDDTNFLSALNLVGAAQLPDVNGSTAATSNRPLGAVSTSVTLNTVNFAGGAVTAGSFSINGATINIDPTVDTLANVLARINASSARVTASYDSTTDSIRVVSRDTGSPTIAFASGSSNFLDVTNLTTATQTAGTNAQFSVNGGPAQISNSNTISTAIPDVTLTLLSIGTTSVTIEQDNDSILEDVRGFVTDFNAAITELVELTGEEGILRNDFSIRSIQNFLRTSVFQAVGGLSGNFNSLVNIGLSSGATFSSDAPFQLSLDEAKFIESLEADTENVSGVFSNDAENGIFDVLFSFLDGVTGTSGYLNERARAGGSISDQIDLLNEQIERVERRVDLREIRLRQQFANLETVINSLNSQATSLSALSVGFNNLNS